MRVCFIFAIVFLAFLDFASAKSVAESEPSHVMEKRDTIHVDPPFPRCVFYECIASCRQRGYKNGGYCTMTGCQCLH